MTDTSAVLEVDVLAAPPEDARACSALPSAADFHQRVDRMAWLLASGTDARLVVVSRAGSPRMSALLERTNGQWWLWKGPAGRYEPDVLGLLARTCASIGATLVLLPEWADPTIMRGAGYVEGEPFGTLRVPSAGDEAAWLSRMTPATRSRVSRARRSGLRVREDPQQLAAFYEIYAAAMTRTGSPDFASQRELATLLELEGVHLFVAEIDGTVAAGSVCLDQPDAIEARYVATNVEHRALAPLNLVHFETIRWAASHRRSWLDLSGFATGDTDEKVANINRFKAGFGGVLVLYPTFQPAPGVLGN